MCADGFKKFLKSAVLEVSKTFDFNFFNQQGPHKNVKALSAVYVERAFLKVPKCEILMSWILIIFLT